MSLDSKEEGKHCEDRKLHWADAFSLKPPVLVLQETRQHFPDECGDACPLPDRAIRRTERGKCCKPQLVVDSRSLRCGVVPGRLRSIHARASCIRLVPPEAPETFRFDSWQ